MVTDSKKEDKTLEERVTDLEKKPFDQLWLELQKAIETDKPFRDLLKQVLSKSEH